MRPVHQVGDRRHRLRVTAFLKLVALDSIAPVPEDRWPPETPKPLKARAVPEPVDRNPSDRGHSFGLPSGRSSLRLTDPRGEQSAANIATVSQPFFGSSLEEFE